MIWFYRAITPLALAWWRWRDLHALATFRISRNVAIHARRGLASMKQCGYTTTPEREIAKREAMFGAMSLAHRLGFLEGWYS